MTADLVIPDEVEPTIAWRAWVPSFADTPRLTSVTCPAEWMPREALTASCQMLTTAQVPSGPALASPSWLWPSVTYSLAHSLPPEAPFEACSCGIYARSKPAGILGFAEPGRVVGTVKLWGRILVGSKGYRAQYAYPDRLYLIENPEWAAEPEWHRQGRARILADTYGVDCTLLSLDEFQLLAAAEGPEPEEEAESRDAPPRRSSGLFLPSLTRPNDGEDEEDDDEPDERSWQQRHAHHVLLAAAALNIGSLVFNLWTATR